MGPPAPAPAPLPPAPRFFLVVGSCMLELAEFGTRLEQPIMVRLAAFVHSFVLGVALTVLFTNDKLQLFNDKYFWGIRRE